MGVGPFHLPALLAEAGAVAPTPAKVRCRPESGSCKRNQHADKRQAHPNFPSFERHAVQMLLYGRPSLKAAALRTVCQTVVAGFKRLLPEYHAGCQCLRGPGA